MRNEWETSRNQGKKRENKKHALGETMMTNEKQAERQGEKNKMHREQGDKLETKAR